MPYVTQIKRHVPATIFRTGNEDGCHIIARTLRTGERDSIGGHTPTTDLRAGLVLSKVVATGKYKIFTTGETAAGLLADDITVVDDNATNITDPIIRMIRQTYNAVVNTGNIPNYEAAVATTLAGLIDFGP